MRGPDRRAARAANCRAFYAQPAWPGQAHEATSALLVLPPSRASLIAVPLLGDEYPDGDFDLADAVDAEAAFETFRAECAKADAAAAGRSLDDTFVSSDGATLDLRWIYLHMIEEYARHNGHADILRERLDGVTGS
jgi:hypothetical protein